MTDPKTPRSINISLGETRGIIFGAGARARATNIATVKHLLENGHTEDEIIDYFEHYFKPQTVLDYIRIAKKPNIDEPTEAEIQKEAQEEDLDEKQAKQEVAEYKKTKNKKQ